MTNQGPSKYEFLKGKNQFGSLYIKHLIIIKLFWNTKSYEFCLAEKTLIGTNSGGVFCRLWNQGL